MPLRNYNCPKYSDCLARAVKTNQQMKCEIGPCDPSKISFEKIPPKEEVIKVNPKEKKCSKCGNTKPLEEFSKNASTPDGLERWCKDCKKKRQQEYRDKRVAEKNGKRRDRPSRLNPVPEDRSFKIDDAILLDQQILKAIKRSVAKEIAGKISELYT